ncbi:hypothetical protein B0I35DRAFT_476298 [Stachybotrys elegans]|uniref:Uncharacterized protein n=1 Tax=Stachybotrys elegans TaxID=80388 RepID=A0A8K0SXD2_9HYPO|nr:hypothetical protein B0I35DRAFT_476298 [Stachybotrys elegans]
MDGNSISSRVALTLDLPPSCIQFCPAYPDHFVVGTYNLEKEEATQDPGADQSDDQETSNTSKKPQSRNGSLLVFMIHDDTLNLVQTVVQPSAILDIRFHPSPDHGDLLAAASSTGSLALFRLDPTKDAISPLKHIATSRCDDLPSDVLFLQCNWHPTIANLIAVTTSTGLGRVLTLDSQWMINNASELDVQNDLEAWCIAFSPSTRWNESDAPVSVYCGGDDSILRYASYTWHLDESNPTIEMLHGPVVIRGQHEAGVTAILPLPFLVAGGGRAVVTGSYDEHIRVFLIHDLQTSYGAKRLQLVADEGLGGGVWRLDLIECRASDDGSVKVHVLASCMHAGARAVEIVGDRDGQWSCRVLGRFEEHKSMNYGSDFARPVLGGRVRCVSTSFYDKLLCLWDCEL